jgi:hypothetical protein
MLSGALATSPGLSPLTSFSEVVYDLILVKSAFFDLVFSPFCIVSCPSAEIVLSASILLLIIFFFISFLVCIIFRFASVTDLVIVPQ